MSRQDNIGFETSEELDKIIDPAFELGMAGVAACVICVTPGEIVHAPTMAEKISLAMFAIVSAVGGAVMAKLGVDDVRGIIRERRGEPPTSSSE